MAKLGEIVTFHTVDGPCAALVIGHAKDGDNDHELAVFANAKTKNSDTGLTGDVNIRGSHADDKPGGFTA
jgi:hypothetical protein